MSNKFQEFQNSNHNLVEVQRKTSSNINKKSHWDFSNPKQIYFHEDEDQSDKQTPESSSNQKNFPQKINFSQQQRQKQMTGLKIPTGSVTRNFFDIEQEEEYQQDNSPTKLLQKIQGKKQIQKRNRKKIKLQPLKNANPQRVQIPESTQKFVQNKAKQEQQKDESLQAVKNPERPNKIQKRKTNNYKLNFQIQSSESQEHTIEIDQTKNKHQQNTIRQLQQSLQNQQINLPPNQRQQQQNQSQRTSMHPRVHIRILGCQQFIIRRDKQWLNKIWPLFNLHKMSNNSYIFSAKMTGNNTSTTFTISESQNDFIQNDTFYLGKVKSNFIGNVINIYNKGYNPTDFKNNKGKLREILATVEYETNFFGSTRPRNFRVFMLKPGFEYYKDLQGTQEGEDQIALNQLYDNELNKQKILVMTNRKPQWNDKIKGFMLNFGGKVKKPSIKNFILEDEVSPNQARLLFGKIDEDQFRLDIGEPISPIIGFGIALSTFGSKIGCQ